MKGMNFMKRIKHLMLSLGLGSLILFVALLSFEKQPEEDFSRNNITAVNISDDTLSEK